jgi:subtilisin family serine protease
MWTCPRAICRLHGHSQVCRALPGWIASFLASEALCGRVSCAAITVGSVDSGFAKQMPSAYGPCVDIFAPGVSVPSLSERGGIDFRTGTSGASAVAAGVAACLRQKYPGSTPGHIVARMRLQAWPRRVLGDLRGAPNMLLRADSGTSLWHWRHLQGLARLMRV